MRQDYVNEILINAQRDLTDKELDLICECVRLGVEDASVKARETARITYGNLFMIFRPRAEKIRNTLPKGIQMKLIAAEKLILAGRTNDESIHADADDAQTTIAGGGVSSASSVSSQQLPPPTPSHSVPISITAPLPTPVKGSSESKTPVGPATRSAVKNTTVATPAHGRTAASGSGTATKRTPAIMATVSSDAINNTPAIALASRSVDTLKTSTTRGEPIAANPNGNAISIAASKDAMEQEKVVVKASRRRSVVKNPFAELSDTFAAGHSPGKHTISSLLKASPRKSPKTTSPSNSTKVNNTKPFAATVSTSSTASGASQPVSSSSASCSRTVDAPITSGPQTPRSSAPAIASPPSPSTPLHVVAAVQDQFVETESHHRVEEDGTDDQEGNYLHHQPANQSTDDLLPLEQEQDIIEDDLNNPAILRVGSKVLVTWGKEPQVNREIGMVRFIGTTAFAGGVWIGVELELPAGKNNGSVQGHFYFSCPPNYGLFVREDNLQIILPDLTSSSLEVPHSVNYELSTGLSELSTTSGSDQSHSSQSTQPENSPLDDLNHERDAIVGSNASVSDDQTLSLSQTLGRSSSQSNNALYPQTAATTRKKSASVLKIKLSQMMNLLNQQLEFVEELEQEERKYLMMNGGSSIAQDEGMQQGSGSFERIHELRDEVYMITAQELDIIEGFRKRWKDLCNL